MMIVTKTNKMQMIFYKTSINNNKTIILRQKIKIVLQKIKILYLKRIIRKEKFKTIVQILQNNTMPEDHPILQI